MVRTETSRSAEIRARAGHPIIDADGHFGELVPVVEGYMEDYVRQVAGDDMARRFLRLGSAARERVVGNRWFQMSPEDRRDTFSPRPAWTPPSLTSMDVATTALPRLLHKRLDEMGIDFTVQFPNYGLWVENALSKPALVDPEWRRIVPRALNSFYADHFREYSDRMTPAALIPMETPEIAIQELDHAVNVLGLKVVCMVGPLFRPIPSIHRQHPELDDIVFRLETFGIDSEYDYDPVWQKCLDLKVVPTFHGWGTKFWGSRASISNYTSAHVGAFASNAEAICRSIFFGGVTRRFPELKIAFLECGVGWACALYADLIGHWAKRNPKTWKELDAELVMGLIGQYADGRTQAKSEAVRKQFAAQTPNGPYAAPSGTGAAGDGVLDDYELCDIQKAQDIHDLFARPFYFGCEADDPMNAAAFNHRANPFGARMQVVLSSDMGHWDAPDMTRIIEEAYELVEKEAITQDDLRDFLFTNPVTLFGGSNPGFFKGTQVEQEAARLLEHCD